MIEHKLNPTQAKYVQQVRDELAKLRKEYLAVLGLAKELELTSGQLKTSYDQQIQLIVSELPRSEHGYKLTDDGKAMVAIELPAPPDAPPLHGVNGSPSNPQLTDLIEFEKGEHRA